MSGTGKFFDNVGLPTTPATDAKSVSWIPVIFSCLMIAVGQSGMGLLFPALPGMQQDLGISSQLTQWMISGYLLGFGPSQLLFGPLSDLYGRRRGR